MPKSASDAFSRNDEPDGAFRSVVGLVNARPFDALASVLALACTAMILVNALALQQGRTAAPEPEFVREAARNAPPTAVARPAATPVYSDLVAQVQTALAERNLYDGVVDGLTGAGTTAAIRAFEKSQGLAQTGEVSEKILAALLTAPMGKPEAVARPASAAQPRAAQAPAGALTTGSTVQDGAKLMAAQKALAKIGYGPITIDGKMGLGTRNAIKSFERDRGMAETGEPTPQVLRALQALTGAPLN